MVDQRVEERPGAPADAMPPGGGEDGGFRSRHPQIVARSTPVKQGVFVATVHTEPRARHAEGPWGTGGRTGPPRALSCALFYGVCSATAAA
ncbi:hypothetical protein HEK131_25470 [Streptomyces seoulensis]|nr:hypothetical protein HEK131_25470 [Streptomyces seoulensis]